MKLENSLFSAKVRYDFNLHTAKAAITATKTVTPMTSIPERIVEPTLLPLYFEVIDAVVAALRQYPETLDAVGMRHIADKLTNRVPHSLVGEAFPPM